MHIEAFRHYCMQLPGTTEDFPFGEETLVFKVGGKMYALAGISSFTSINLKCDPELAVELRERYPSVTPGYHMNKKHWNTVLMDGSVPDRELKTWITDSYMLVRNALPLKTRKEIEAL